MQVVAVLQAAEAAPAAGAPTWDRSTAQAFNGSGPRGHGTPVQRGSSEEEAAGPVRVMGAEREALYKMYSEHIEARYNDCTVRPCLLRCSLHTACLRSRPDCPA